MGETSEANSFSDPLLQIPDEEHVNKLRGFLRSLGIDDQHSDEYTLLTKAIATEYQKHTGKIFQAGQNRAPSSNLLTRQALYVNGTQRQPEAVYASGITLEKIFMNGAESYLTSGQLVEDPEEDIRVIAGKLSVTEGGPFEDERNARVFEHKLPTNVWLVLTKIAAWENPLLGFSPNQATQTDTYLTRVANGTKKSILIVERKEVFSPSPPHSPFSPDPATALEFLRGVGNSQANYVIARGPLPA